MSSSTGFSMESLNANQMFVDPSLAKEMSEKGYVVLPFLDTEMVRVFNDLYQKYHPVEPEGFYKSYFSTDMSYKLEVENLILDAFEKKLGHLFRDHVCFGGMFVAKPPLEKGHFTAHQDWSFTDEAKFPSYNMWCPLDDVNDENGNLNALSGSHRFIRTVRGFDTPDVYDHLHENLEPNMTSLPMKAGEVVIFHHSLVHGSTENLTEVARVSIGLSLIHKNAPWEFHHYDSRTHKLEVFQSNPDFYLNYAEHQGERPQNLKLLGQSEFDFPRLTLDELRTLVRTNQGQFVELEPTDSGHQEDSDDFGCEEPKQGIFHRIFGRWS